MARALAMLAKSPRPGQVKTRLCPPLTPADAARLHEAFVATRSTACDQGMLVRADVFHRLGGFKDLALMEDLDFSQRLKRAGRTVLIRAPLRTSGRRFIARGP